MNKTDTAVIPIKDRKKHGLKSETLINIAVPICAVLAGLLLAAGLVIAAGVDPIKAYGALITGAFGDAWSTGNSLGRATPLILAGLGVAFAFKSGVWNVGAEGQIYIGALCATLVGLFVKGLPAFIHLPLSLLAGFTGGAIWGGIAGYLKARFKINEVISTLMLNYIAIYIVGALVRGPIIEFPNHEPQTAQVAESARLPIIFPDTRLSAGILLAIIAVGVVYLILRRTPIGYEVRAVGESPTAAKHAGMNIVWIQVLAMLISGGLAGLAGTSEVLGAQYRLRDMFLPNYGYDALAVAMLGQLHPIGVFISGIFFGALRAGSGTMQRMVGLPSSLVFVIQGAVVFMVVSTVIFRELYARSSRKEKVHVE
ncbi:MAG: ABC transporter permease [Anaerolineaceae bacterium]|nr:ABC transporter permease [Anaerolineaceae bacterium]